MSLGSKHVGAILNILT